MRWGLWSSWHWPGVVNTNVSKAPAVSRGWSDCKCCSAGVHHPMCWELFQPQDLPAELFLCVTISMRWDCWWPLAQFIWLDAWMVSSVCWELSPLWKGNSWISTGGIFVTCNKLFCDCEPCSWLKCKRKLVWHLAFVRVRLSFLLSWLKFHEFWVNLSWVTFWLG